jgi:hypothetical protein
VHRSWNQLVLVIAACAAAVAQATPTAICFACDHGCCSATIGGSGQETTAAGQKSSNGCPLCGSRVGALSAEAETDSQPCNCQLDTRQDQPLSPSRNSLQQTGDDTPADGLPGPWSTTPPALGLSRDYAALALAMPIRPARILFGVWRN